MDYSHFSNDDLKALKAKDYSKLSTAALSYIRSNNPTKGPDLGQLQAEDQPVQPASVVADAIKGGGQGTRALGTLAATGGDLNEASGVAQGQSATSTAGKVGSFVGDLVSPASIGMMAVAAPVGRVAGEAIGAMVGKGLMGQAELDAAMRAKQGLSAKFAQKAAALEDLSGQAGKEIEAAQGARNVGMVKQGIPELPKNLNDFANEMRQLAGKDVGSAMDLEGLQKLKDTITVARQSGKLSPAQSAMVSKAAEKIDAAIAEQAPEIGNAMGKFRTVADAQDALKNDQILQRMKLQDAISKIRSDMRMNPATKAAKIGKLLATGGAAGATYEGFKHFLGK